MTRPPLCSYCVLPTEGVKRIRCKRTREWIWVCALRKHLGCVAPLTARQRGIVARRMVEMAGGG